MLKWTKWLPAILAVAALVLFVPGCSKQAKKKRYLSRADADFQAQRYDRAEVEYLAVLTIPPPNPEALAKLAKLYFTEGKLQQAYVLSHQALQLQPDDRPSRSRLGAICLSMGFFAEAREVALRLLETQPQDTDALLLLAQSTLNTNQVDDVQQRLDTLPASARDTAAYHLARGTALVIQQEMDKAENEFKAAIACAPKSSTAYLVLGNFYVIRNETRQAEEAFKTASSLAPFRSAERLRYADWQLRNGETNIARGLLEEITHQAPDFVPAWTFLARLAFAQRRLEECNSLLNTVLARDPLNLQGLLLKGNQLLESRDAANAVLHFRQVAQIYSNCPPVFYGLALAHLSGGEVEEALAALNRSLAVDPNFSDSRLLLADLNLRRGDVPSAIAILSPLLREQPQLAQAHLLLASAYLVKNRPEEALAVYHQMAQQFPMNRDVPFLTGLVLFQQRKMAEARRAFEDSLRLSPGYLAPVEQLVELDLLERQYAAATQRVEAQIAKDPNAAEPYLLMAKIHVAQALKPGTNEATNRFSAIPIKLELDDTPQARQHAEKAEESLRKAIALKSEQRNGYLLLAQLLVATHQHQKALDGLLRFVSGTKDVAALTQIGMIYEQLTNYPAARDAYEKVLKLSPRFSVALNNLAYLYSEQFHELDKAYAMAVKARELLPFDPATADTLGWILYKQGQYTRALGLLGESAMKLRDDPEVQYHLGMTYYMMGNEEAAKTALERAVGMARDFAGGEARRRVALLAINIENAGAPEVAELEKFLHEHPGDPVALARLGGIQSQRGEYQNALSSYQTALKRYPQNTELMLRLAELYFEHLNDSPKALELTQEANKLAPENARICRLLGRLTYQTGDYALAASLLEKADHELPDEPAALYDLAWSYYNLGRVGEAETKMQKVAAGDAAHPKHAEAERFLTLVAALRQPGWAQTNVLMLQNILREQPDYTPALMVSASLLEEQGDFPKAAQIYSEIRSRNLLFTPATRKLALLYAEHLADEAKAYELVVQAREFFPDDVRLTRALGILYYRRGDYRRAAEVLESGTRASSKDAEQFYYLGMAHYQLKETKESKAALAQALALGLNAQLESEATRVLNTMN
jgi:tetratricopeptide (TPR) repeat protein